MWSLIFFEVVPSLLGIIFLLLSNRGNRWSWLFLCATLSIVAYNQFLWKQYAGVLLILVWSVPYSIYNFFSWKKLSSGSNDNKIGFLESNEKVSFIALVIALSSFILVILTRNVTDVDYIYVIFDAISTAVTIISYPLLQRKKCEGWLCYIAGDSMRCLLFLKSPMLVGFYVICVVIDIINLITWRKESKKVA
ncbi:MAG: nicotinamide mononucleotide transporter family protein [Rickettsiales bacterium]|jgi:nicotinamide mononucleotide transporter PnuC|nr:nicotinamide mononucleotide transporter family protein [Rickettsiales bacterium]